MSCLHILIPNWCGLTMTWETLIPLGQNRATSLPNISEGFLIYHIKDVTLDSNGKNVSTDLGQGKIDLKAVIAPLLHSNWHGWLTVEREVGYPNAAPNPQALLRQCRTYLREISGV